MSTGENKTFPYIIDCKITKHSRNNKQFIPKKVE